ncbi:MAG: hypothetical protein WBI71_00190 [Methanothermobacter tenebrarum]
MLVPTELGRDVATPPGAPRLLIYKEGNHQLLPMKKANPTQTK